MKFIDLFCGCGGFTEGMKQAGHIPVLGVDLEEIALESYEANHHCEVWNKDVREIVFEDLPEVDFIIGSPPCQEFTEIKRNNLKEMDLSLLNKFIEIGSHYEVYIGENVKGIKKHLNGTFYQLLSANNFGLFQKRERCFYGNFERVIKLTRNPIYFPTPLANTNETGQIYCQTPLFTEKKRFQGRCMYPPHVAKWIMGFPDEYIVLGSPAEQIRQIGNAVCPPVAKAIGKVI